MNFTTHSDENGTKNHSTLDDAFSHAEEDESVEQISFVLPTKEKVCLDRDMDDWSYNPIDSAEARYASLEITDLEAKVLRLCLPEAPLYYAETDEEGEMLDDLTNRGFLEIVFTKDEDGENTDYWITNLGMRALTVHR